MRATLQQEDNRTKASIASFVFHAILLAILFFYRFGASEQPIQPTVIELDMSNFGGGGDNAAAGLPDEGQGNDPAPQGDPTATAQDEPADEPAPSKPAPAPPSTSAPSKPSPAAEVPKNTPTANDPNSAAVRQAEEKKRQEQEKIKQQQDEQRRQAEAVERERQRVAQEAADKARREQEERDKKKGQFGGTFGKPGATGSGQGNTGKPGNQGIPGGTGDNPFGKSTGTGGGTGGGTGTGTGTSIGGGLGNRGVVRRGRIVDDSQKSGKMAFDVCVDGDGNILSVDFTQRGSTFSDSDVRNKAIAGIKQYKFAPSDNPKQCGTFIINFSLQ